MAVKATRSSITGGNKNIVRPMKKKTATPIEKNTAVLKKKKTATPKEIRKVNSSGPVYTTPGFKPGATVSRKKY